MNDLKRLSVIGFIFVAVAGTLFHFVYDWSGSNHLLGLFVPVNESTWEHMKLCFFPMLLFSFYMNAMLKDSYPCISDALPVGILTATFLVPVLFYTYSGILGRNIAALDIATFFISVLVAFVVIYRLTRSCRTTFSTAAKLLLPVIFLCFLLFTYHPPGLGIFVSPV